MSEQTIPVVDLSDWTSGDPDRQAHFARTLGDALTDLGFFAITGHGVDPDLLGQAYGQVGHLFELPEDQKRAYEIEALKGQRGFTRMGREHAKDHPVPDLKEFWHVGQEEAAGYEVNYAENIWPTELDRFRPVMLDLYTRLEDCARSLLEACADYIGMPRNTFSDMIQGGDTVLRLIHYPPVPQDAPVGSLRAAPHEDINLITLLVESTDEGLELLQRDGQWRPIHALKGQMVVDAGDMLQQVTNGLFKSTTHRVVNPSDDRSRRFSMPFFVHPRGEVDLTPLEACVERTGGARAFPEITARQFLNQRLEEIGLGQ